MLWVMYGKCVSDVLLAVMYDKRLIIICAGKDARITCIIVLLNLLNKQILVKYWTQ